MLPVVLLGCALWLRGRITRQDVLQLSPYFILSLAFGLMSVWFQKHQALVMSGLTLQPESFWQRSIGAGRDFWFYLGKALLPAEPEHRLCALETGCDNAGIIPSVDFFGRGFCFVLAIPPQLGTGRIIRTGMFRRHFISGARLF